MATELVAAGWNYPLDFTSGGDFALAAGARRLEQSMRLILATYPGERPMRADFGSRLRDFVFESSTLDHAADLGREVRRALDRWEPRVEIQSVEVVPDPGRPGLIHLDIRYIALRSGEERAFTFPFHTIPDGEGD